jgi:hypothetical protein
LLKVANLLIFNPDGLIMPITDDERERAARALCRGAGYSEDTLFEGRPAWAWYLDQVDMVLVALASSHGMKDCFKKCEDCRLPAILLAAEKRS